MGWTAPRWSQQSWSHCRCHDVVGRYHSAELFCIFLGFFYFLCRTHAQRLEDYRCTHLCSFGLKCCRLFPFSFVFCTKLNFHFKHTLLSTVMSSESQQMAVPTSTWCMFMCVIHICKIVKKKKNINIFPLFRKRIVRFLFLSLLFASSSSSSSPSWLDIRFIRSC